MEATHRSRSAFTLALGLLTAGAAGCESLGKFFRLTVQAPSTVVAGSPFDVTVSATCEATLKIDFQWIDPQAEAVLSAPFIEDGVIVPEPSSLYCLPGETKWSTLHFQSLDSARLGAHHLDLRARDDDSHDTEFAAIDWVVVRPTVSTHPPAMPLLSASPRASSVVLAWNEDPIVGSYRLERADAGGQFQALAPSLAGTVTSYEDRGLTPQTAYEYRLTAINPNGESPPATVSVTTLALATTATLTVIVTGNGTVTSSPAGISCPGDCSELFPLTPVTDVTLTASPSGGAIFTGWSLACAGSALTAVVHLDADQTCAASFVTPTTGWQTILGSLAASDFLLPSATMLDGSGQAFIAYVQTLGVQGLITVAREANGAFPRYGGALNATFSWSAFQPALVLDPDGQPIVAFAADQIAAAHSIVVARWDDVGKQWQFLTLRANLTNTDGNHPQVAVVGNTLVVAWTEQQQVAVARHDLSSTQWDASNAAFVPNLSGVTGIDLALDSSGQAVIAYTVGFTDPVLRAVRETGAGTWTSLGGDISGPLPPTSQQIDYFGVHLDAADTVRVVWSEGGHPFVLRAGSFDGTTWQPAFGSSLTVLDGPTRFRALAVNRTGRLFAFAAAYDVEGGGAQQSTISVYRLQGTVATIIGGSTLHPEVRSLSMAMLNQDQPTVVHSQFDTTGSPPPYTLPVRRYSP